MWENRTSMPKTIAGRYTPVVVDDKIYVIGGAEPAPLGVVKISANNYVYDPATDAWSEMASIPTPVTGYAAAVSDNKIYIISGGTLESAYMGNTTDVVQVFDPKTNQWTNGAPIPTGVYAAGACSTSGYFAPKRIYVVGGQVDFSPGGTSADLVDYGINLTQVYDPETETWSSAASIPDIRWGLSLVNVMDALYAVGGVNGTVQVYVSADLSDWEAAKQLMSTIRVQATCKYIPIGYDGPLLPTASPSPTASPTAEPFPTVPVAAASIISVVVVIAGLLVYYKKRNREAGQG
jgi:N-acetylneuraminic acid mutarotase